MPNTNEIRDYIERAPKRGLFFNGAQIVSTMHVRLKWLSEIAHGTIDQRINRRAGIVIDRPFYKYPVGSSIARHARRVNVQNFGRA
jgi:hypothetical protein